MARIFFIIFCLSTQALFGQGQWTNCDSLFGSLPRDFHVFFTDVALDGDPFKAWYVEADLKSKNLDFTCDTTVKRRITPVAFYEKNDKPLLVVNTTFFSFETNSSLNIVIKDGKLVSRNVISIPLKGKDTLMFRHSFASAIGISKKRKADIAWIFSDSTSDNVYASQNALKPIHDSLSYLDYKMANIYSSASRDTNSKSRSRLVKWKVQTAVGGGPVLVQDGKIAISNNEEMKFAGKALYDKHPRTLMGYTNRGKLIVMVIEGRNPGEAMGANLLQAASLMQQLGCIEALNLDGGGSSSMLVNGIKTIHPSDNGNERPVPAVFLINRKSK